MSGQVEAVPSAYVCKLGLHLLASELSAGHRRSIASHGICKGSLMLQLDFGVFCHLSVAEAFDFEL